MPTVTTADGVSLHYDAFGEPDRPVVLLIQGLGAHLLGWREGFCRTLAAGGYRVVRFDNRDVGLSDHFPAGGYDLARMADDTAGLLEALGTGPVHVVGQSMGGMIAQYLALHHPGCVLSLALLYTTPGLEHVVGADLVRDRLEAPPHPTRDEAAARYVENERPCASAAYPQDTAWLRELGGLMFDRCYDPAGIARQTAVVMSAPDRSPLLPAITVPTTIVHGTADRLIDPAGSRALHALIPGSTLTLLDGMGHELPEPLWETIIGRIRANVEAVVAA